MPDSLRATSIRPQRRRRCSRTRHEGAAASLCAACLQCSKRGVAQPIDDFCHVERNETSSYFNRARSLFQLPTAMKIRSCHVSVNLLEVTGFLAPLGMTSHVAIERSRHRSNRKHQLVPKVPHTGEYHRHFALVSCGDHFFIANRAAWLNSTGCAGFGSSDQSVWERKKSVD